MTWVLWKPLRCARHWTTVGELMGFGPDGIQPVRRTPPLADDEMAALTDVLAFADHTIRTVEHQEWVTWDSDCAAFSTLKLADVRWWLREDGVPCG